MALIDQKIAERYALYHGDCCEVVAGLPTVSVDLSVYSPPFCGLYNYSSDDRDLSNSRTYDEFFRHYGFLVEHMARVTKPGRMSVVHCTDIPNPGQKTGYFDLPGAITALHQQHGFHYFGRVAIWKEPLAVAIRTRLRHLTHKQLVKDSCASTIAAADFILIFKREGHNADPVAHPEGFSTYAGAMEIPPELLKYRGTTEQKENKLSHWIWRRYASSVWDDIRVDRVLPYREAKEPDDEKHVHPLQLDVVERCVQLWSNSGDVLMTPFMGVGSETYGAVANGRRAIGVELKASYFKQAVRNTAAALTASVDGMPSLFDQVAPEELADDEAAA
jgi:DNA modification methylase